MKIYIPTYRRKRQHTWERLPQKWRDQTILVVDQQDADVHKDKQTLLCPVQGTGIEHVRKWLAEHAAGTCYAVFDDDIRNFCYTRLAHETHLPFINNALTDEQFDHVFAMMQGWMDEGFAHTGFEVRWAPPNYKIDYSDCMRATAAHFWNGRDYAIEELDFTSIPFCEDYYLILQLLTSGRKNRISYRYRILPEKTQHAGGCSDQRTIEKHNAGVKMLAEKYPNFVKVAEKTTKTGAWSEQVKLRLEIQWKKAYASSQGGVAASTLGLTPSKKPGVKPATIMRETTSLEDFF